MITVYVFDKDKQILLSYIKKKLYNISMFLKKIISIYLIFKKEYKNLNIVILFQKIITIFLYKNLKKEIRVI
jgi:hypothetical protein